MTSAAAWLNYPEHPFVAKLRADLDTAHAQLAAVRDLAHTAQTKTTATAGLVSARALLAVVGEDES